MLKGGAGRSLPPLPIIDRASICPCPVGKADPALAHVPLVKALRYLAYPCCLRSRLHMEVFGLSPTFHASVPLLVSSSEWPAGSLGPPSRKPPPSCSRGARCSCSEKMGTAGHSPRSTAGVLMISGVPSVQSVAVGLSKVVLVVKRLLRLGIVCKP